MSEMRSEHAIRAFDADAGDVCKRITALGSTVLYAPPRFDCFPSSILNIEAGISKTTTGRV